MEEETVEDVVGNDDAAAVAEEGELEPRKPGDGVTVGRLRFSKRIKFRLPGQRVKPYKEMVCLMHKTRENMERRHEVTEDER